LPAKITELLSYITRNSTKKLGGDASVNRMLCKSSSERTGTMKAMKGLLPLSAVLLVVTGVSASSLTRYLHVRVTDTNTHELVRVNVPLSLAEKVIPAINHGQLRNGKVEIGNMAAKGINVKAILEALKSAPEGEFVTVEETDSDVRVAKERGLMVVHVTDKRSKEKEKVDVTIPWEVAQALASGTDDNQLNIEAAIKALETAGDVTLVNVTSHDQIVRVWVDSSSTAD
jgi:ribonuclease HI